MRITSMRPWHNGLTALATIAALLTAPGCGDTGPSRVAFDVEVAGGSGQNLSNDHGYTVTLSKASLHVGAVHFFSGEPLFTRHDESFPSRLARLFVGVAHAHPGHYQEGSAMAEVLQGGTIDLLGQPRRLGRASGVTGTYRSAQVTLTGSADNGNHLAMAEGKATMGSQEVSFSVALDGTLKVAGIVAGTTVDESGPLAVRVVVDLKRWVELMDFSKLAGGVQPVTIKPGTQAHNAFSRGVSNTSAFLFNWKTP